MTDIIDIQRARASRDQPDADCVRKDDYGRALYLFALHYEMDSHTWGTEVWAYSWEDAEARVAAMRDSLCVSGQMMAIVPA
jgi:hypothetical protein